MITLRGLMEYRKAAAERAGETAHASGAQVYGLQCREVAATLRWLLTTDIDTVEIDREGAQLIDEFLALYAVEFDEFLQERASIYRRSQITASLASLKEQVPSRALNVAARHDDAGSDRRAA